MLTVKLKLRELVDFDYRLSECLECHRKLMLKRSKNFPRLLC